MARYFAPDGITLKHTIVFLIFQESHRDGLVGVLSSHIFEYWREIPILEAIATDCCFKNYSR